MQRHVDDRILEMLLSNDDQVIQLLYATYYTPLRRVLSRRVATIEKHMSKAIRFLSNRFREYLS